MEKRMPKNFKDFNGNVWDPAYINIYNKYTDEINRAHINDKSWLLDNRHKFFVRIVNAIKDGTA